MSTLVRAEVRKLLTTRLWWSMLLGALAFAALGVVAQIATNGLRNNPAPPLTSAVTQRTIIASATGGYIFSAIVGVIIITTEFRHFTSRPTFLIEPRRARVIAAKILVSAGLGLLYGVAAVAVALAIAVPWLTAKHVTVDWLAGDLVRVMVGAVFVVAIFAIVGLGVGVLIRNQVAAVVSTLAYLFVVEPLIAVIPVVKEVFRYLPGGAAQALTSGARNGSVVLVNWQGGLVLLGWGLLFAALGWVLTVRRDIP